MSTHDFEPLYIISPEKKSTVSELKGLLKDVDELYLATDGDREGEAIAWHLLETLKPRMVRFGGWSSTRSPEPAILEAAENPRDLDIDLVDAQETRRNPGPAVRLAAGQPGAARKKVARPSWSAGRVQSVATRTHRAARPRRLYAWRSAR